VKAARTVRRPHRPGVRVVACAEMMTTSMFMVESRSGAVACRPGHSGDRPFRLPVPEEPALRSVSTPRSSNRTGGFPASNVTHNI